MGRERHLPVCLALLAAVLVLAYSAGLLSPALLHLAPALLLALPLVAGRFLGEDAIERRVAAWRGTTPRSRSVPFPAGAVAAPGIARGSLLLAASLAERGPPRAVVN